MTTHFKATFKNRGTMVVPHCSRFAMSPKYGATTENKAEVDCKRCAKDLGITPAAKVESGSPTGTCQCCFGTFKLPHGKGLTSIHGYKRPGIGYIFGECRGQQHLPYEKSCEQTKKYLGEVVAHIAFLNGYLAKLEANEVHELPCRRDTYPEANIPWHRQKAVSKTFTVKRGDKYTHHHDLQCTTPDFEDLLAGEIRDIKRSIKQAESEREFLAEKVASWKLVA